MSFLESLRNDFFHLAPILIAGVIASAIVLERFRALLFAYPLRGRGKFFDKLRDLVMTDRMGEAIALCDRYRSKPSAMVVREALVRAHQPDDLIEQGIQLTMGEIEQRVQKRTPYLATIANVSTLLGLFGTILGLIQSFQAVGAASAQQKSVLLAQGIATAMNATMMGLAVAIPCMIFFSYLMNHTNKVLAETEQSAVKILDIIKQRHFAAESDPNLRSRRSA